ncbi:MAG: hypothetical protein LBD24_05545 [Spirochaetaceae bacterium]|jgi:hypothetical protein|nr:hypothetical protein [Spirochaetaceae bacterium]
MARESIKDEGKSTRFSKENQPENRGRKPSLLKKWIKEYDIPISDVRAVMTNLMFAYTLKEIKEIADREEGMPVGISVMAKGLAADIESGNPKNLEKMLDRSFGKTAPEKTVEARGMSEEAGSRMAVLLREETAAADGGNVPEPPRIIPRNTLKDDDDR